MDFFSKSDLSFKVNVSVGARFVSGGAALRADTTESVENSIP